ncbi:RtcB family protein (plasmid) [Trichlorobacter lovleyi]|nr:RtcB family protein [Trichlorobacter lovleyi]
MEQIEQSAQQQIYDVLRLDCLKKLAIMPDVHAGYDLCIGGVALLDGMISPSFVGYDIGCGICYVDTGVTAAELFPRGRKDMELVQRKIMERIPTGFSSLSSPVDGMVYDATHLPKDVSSRAKEKSRQQMGTLGGGNHFIEIGENRAGNIVVTIHSGSRNVGHTLGGYYMKQGRMFPLDSELGQMYQQDLQFSLDWALENRRQMILEILDCLVLGYQSKKILATMVNENHNHAVVTGEGVLHRKGATPAEAGQLGIIPANMRDGVYITEGLGNDTYLSSASHGCGRKMGRNQAKKTLDLEQFQGQMKDVVSIADKTTLDEAPGAYKDIKGVLALQEGVVVTVVDFARPLINIKAQGD